MLQCRTGSAGEKSWLIIRSGWMAVCYSSSHVPLWVVEASGPSFGCSWWGVLFVASVILVGFEDGSSLRPKGRAMFGPSPLGISVRDTISQTYAVSNPKKGTKRKEKENCIDAAARERSAGKPSGPARTGHRFFVFCAVGLHQACNHCIAYARHN